MKPVLLEEGLVAQISLDLIQDMLNASLKYKSPEEISLFLESRDDSFLSEAHLVTKAELLAFNAPQKFGFWLHDDERQLLTNEKTFWTGKYKPNFVRKFDAPPPEKKHNIFGFFNNSPKEPPPPQYIKPLFRRRDTPSIHWLIQITRNAAKPFDPAKPGRIAYGIIPVAGTNYVIFSRQPQQRPPVISTLSVILNTGLLLLILLGSAFILIYPIIRRLRSIQDTCTRVSMGDYKARCADKSEDSIGVLAKHIDEMTASIERHLGQQKSLLQAVSHELRTPLSRIRFSIEMLDIPDDDEKSMARLDSIDDDLTEIDNLIKELSYFNYVDAGKGKQHFETSAIKDLISLTLEQRSLSIDEFNITTSDIPDDMTIEADPTAFKRVIGNLISNAARYAQKHIHIDVSYLNDKNFIQICVDDDGPGIPEDKRTTIFEPFVCLEASRSKSMSGCGLGLAIADRIMKVHNGSIEVLDSPIGGTRMRTIWPVIQDKPL